MRARINPASTQVRPRFGVTNDVNTGTRATALYNRARHAERPPTAGPPGPSGICSGSRRAAFTPARRARIQREAPTRPSDHRLQARAEPLVSALVTRSRSDEGPRLDRSLTGALRPHLAPHQQSTAPRRATGSGTGALPLSEHVARPSGLLVPRRHAASPGPIDLLKVYVTDQEIFGFRIGIERATTWLKRISLNAALRFATHWTCLLQTYGTDQQELDRSFARTYLKGDALARCESAVDRGQRILVPQVLLVLLKIALFQCADDRADDENAEFLPVVMLAIAGALGTIEDDDGDKSRALEAEIIANQHFNSNHDLTNTMALFGYRWTTPDETGSALEEAYLDATGVALRDVAVVALSLWAAVQNGASRVSKDYFQHLNWPQERLDGALDLISAPVESLRESIRSDEQAENWEAVGWLFSPLERHPVLQWQNDYIVISPRFLQERVFGWPAVFDLQHALRTDNRASDAERAIGRLREKTETYTRDVLDSIASSQEGLARRVYHERSLKEAFGASDKTADAAIDYGDAWAVVEISTRRLARPVVYARHGAIEQEIEVLIAKCKQLDATIKKLRRDESRLTGHPPAGPRRFYPILVMTEGYAVNPVVNLRLREVLHMKRLLSGKDTGPVEIMDLQTLELVESVAEAGGPTLVELIRGKGSSGMANAGLWDYMVVERNFRVERNRRLQESWATPFNWALDALEPSQPDD